MHGLALRAMQLFVTDQYGSATWSRVLAKASLEFDEFEAMLTYPDELGERTLDAVSAVLDRPREEMFEDLGTYLVSHPNTEVARRLLRFGGTSFEEFLHSLNDLPDRARLALPNLELPRIELREHSGCHFSLICRGQIACFGHVLMGLLRAMADDYGVLALVEHRGGGQGTETLSIKLLESSFAKGREFALGALPA
jgi:hypothetical protein